MGKGVLDGGAGAVVAMAVLRVLEALELQPRRTLRLVLWTAEEIGALGAKSYAERHADEREQHVAAIEADAGAGRPIGYSLHHEVPEVQEVATRQLRDIVRLP